MKEDRKMAVEVFNRYEHKYLLDRETYKKLISVIEAHMELDRYNEGGKPYTISNIYYDTSDDYLIRRSIEAPKYKEKLRLRAYGVPNKEAKVFLEIKKKVGGLVNKRRTALGLYEAYQFAQNGDLPEIKDYMNGQVVKEIKYFLKMYNLSPKLYLAYDRIAYFEKENSDLRISFDCNIRTRRYDLRLENGDYGEQLLDRNTYLMEIKTSRAKPLWLTNALTELGVKRIGFSKYGTEYKQYIISGVKELKQAI